MIVNAKFKLKYGSGDTIIQPRYAELSFLYATLSVDLSIILPCIIKIFLTVAELCSLNENEVKIWIRGNNYKKNMQSCMQHSKFNCSIILPSIIKIFLMVTELCSGNEKNEGRIWIRGHN